LVCWLFHVQPRNFAVHVHSEAIHVPVHDPLQRTVYVYEYGYVYGLEFLPE